MHVRAHNCKKHACTLTKSGAVRLSDAHTYAFLHYKEGPHLHTQNVTL